uniref:Uncharacterized protein n=1 Tax=Amphimedon queenslandica TaxID=400682 RepID=A0A1X7TV05_AMPQE
MEGRGLEEVDKTMIANLNLQSVQAPSEKVKCL